MIENGPKQLPNLDPAEYIRGVVASMSLGTDQKVREVHIKQIQHVWSRTGQPVEEMTASLKAMRLLGEVENIGNGYWLPTPTRAVPVSKSKLMVIAVAPTVELQRHISSIHRAGLGRLMEYTHERSLPIQSFRSWSGITEDNANILMSSLIESTESSFEYSVAPAGLEVFCVRSIKKQADDLRRIPMWCQYADPNFSKVNMVSLYRNKVGFNKYRYFLGKQGRNNRFLEGPIISDNLSVQYGLALKRGEPLTAFVKKKEDSFNITLPLSAPFMLRKVLLALCDGSSGLHGRDWVCYQPECRNTILSAIKNTGCEIHEYE